MTDDEGRAAPKNTAHDVGHHQLTVGEILFALRVAEAGIREGMDPEAAAILGATIADLTDVCTTCGYLEHEHGPGSDEPTCEHFAKSYAQE